MKRLDLRALPDELADRLQRSDPSAVPAFKKWWAPARGEAEDVADLVCDKLSDMVLMPEGIAALRDAKSIRSLLATMVRTAAADRARGLKSRARAAEGWSHTPGAGPVDPHPSPDQIAEAREELDLTEEQLKVLPKRQRDAIRLHRLQGQSVEETARAIYGDPVTDRDKHAVVELVRRGCAKLAEHRAARDREREARDGPTARRAKRPNTRKRARGDDAAAQSEGSS